jgi:inorganic triphosphatase YgiF
VPQDREVELKFLCSPEDLASVLAASPAGDEESRELISVYFDTPDRALQKAGASLRVRESKGSRVQTLKRGEGFSREEHEAPIAGFAPDPSLGPLKRLLPQGESLKAAFNVRVNRRQRTFRYEGAEIELALDQGEVTGGAARSPICEVELELKSGPPAALFALARELAKAAPLYLSFDAKAARGQALVAGEPLQPRHSQTVVIPADIPAGEAFQAVARNALAQIAANAALLRAAPGAEAVHQLRVAARRLRSVLSTFKAVVRDDALDPLKAELRWLARSCDEARNLDVFTESILTTGSAMPYPPAGLMALSETLENRRREVWSEVAATASSERFRMLMIDVTAWVETGAWLSRPQSTTASAFAQKALEHRRRKVLKSGKALAQADDAARHHLRIQSKKLRYTAEAFVSLYPGKAAPRFIRYVKGLQDVLGELNDLATIGPLVAGLKLKSDAAYAAGELAGWRSAGKAGLIASATKAFDRLEAADLFWG